MDSTTLLLLLLLPFPILLLLLLPILRPPPRRLPPSPPSLPFIGHLHLLTSSPHLSLAALASKVGPIMHLRLGRVPTVVVSSREVAKEVLKTHDAVFANRPRSLVARYLSFDSSDVSFSPSGPYWRMVRRICVTELLSPRRVGSFQFVRDQEVDRLLRSIAADSSNGTATNLTDRFFDLANDFLCRVAFGRRFSESKTGLLEVFEETQRLFAGFDVGEFFPELGWVNSVTGLKRRLEKNLEDLKGVFNEIIREHEERGGEGKGEEREDFVDVLLRVQRSEGLEVPITDDNIKAVVLVIFISYLFSQFLRVDCRWTL